MNTEITSSPTTLSKVNKRTNERKRRETKPSLRLQRVERFDRQSQEARLIERDVRRHFAEENSSCHAQSDL
jgi:hypothetical protein